MTTARDLLDVLGRCSQLIDLVDLYASGRGDDDAKALLRSLVARERAKVLAPPVPVFKRCSSDRFEVGVQGRTHEARLPRGALLAWLVLDGRVAEANAHLDTEEPPSERRGESIRKQLKQRLPNWLQDRAKCSALATEVRAAIVVSREGVLSMARASRVLTR